MDEGGLLVTGGGALKGMGGGCGASGSVDSFAMPVLSQCEAQMGVVMARQGRVCPLIYFTVKSVVHAMHDARNFYVPGFNI